MLGDTLKGYIWRKKWCWPYESAWGILEKFKYANALDNSVFDMLFNLKVSPVTFMFVKELGIYRNAQLDYKLFYSVLGVPNNHFTHLNVFLGNQPKVIFRQDLYYCPKCIELGYHSYWHQISLITRCPFHDIELMVASQNEKNIKYSIFTLRTEAFSSMRDTKSRPAKRFVQILPSNMLIDGPWDNICKEITFTQSSLERIIFYNPFFDLQGIVNLPKEETYKLMYNLLIDKDTHITPLIKISINECEQQLSNIISEAMHWFESKHLLYNQYLLDNWYINNLINTLMSPYEHEEITDAIRKIPSICRDNVILTERSISLTATLLTAYKISNARTIWESIDDSLILKPTTHYVRRNIFYLDEMEQLITNDSKIHKYINYLIYEQLVGLLNQHIKKLLIHSKDQSLDYEDKIYFNIPDYVVTLKDSMYEIYEFPIDN